MSAGAWTKYRIRRNLLLALMICYPTLLPLLAPLMERLGFRATMIYLLAVVWMAAIATAGIRLAWFRCPRCGHLFHLRFGFFWPLARRCLHCGLRKFDGETREQVGS